MDTLNEYEKQAHDFLEKYHINMTISKVGSQPSPFYNGNWNKNICDKYIVVLTRTNTKGKPLTFSFPFWGSIVDHENGVKVTPYDVISCGLSGGWHYYTEKDYYSEFGNLPNNIDEILSHAKRIRQFFTPKMRNDLDEIN